MADGFPASEADAAACVERVLPLGAMVRCARDPGRVQPQPSVSRASLTAL